MLRQIENLPTNVIGIRAEGKVTRADYETMLHPLLENARRAGHRIRFLYELGPAFTGFTAGAVIDDFYLSIKYLNVFEGCAVVSDLEWVRDATQRFGSVLPFPVRTFRNSQMIEALPWLNSYATASRLKCELREDGVAIVEPQGPLAREDFDKIASIVDPWIETHKRLHGVVISTKKFPGWENLGSFIHHLQFIRGHHRNVEKVALAVEGLGKRPTPPHSQFGFRRHNLVKVRVIDKPRAVGQR